MMVAIGTLGSHSALNILKGAKDEGFRTVCICRERDKIVYQRFPLVDEFIMVKEFDELLSENVQRRLEDLDTVLIPHGSFNAYVGAEAIEDELFIPVFGNKHLLRWETDREKQRQWLSASNLRLPDTIGSPKDINGPVIVKFPGALGGRGYFLASSERDFYEKGKQLLAKGEIAELDESYLQEYIIGTNIYPVYFSSILNDEVEFFGADKRYESNADILGRVPAAEQLALGLQTTYTVVGNLPLTIRESLLARYIEMGDDVVASSKHIAAPGIIGPFCLETIVTEKLEVITFEISARIVAGTNVGIGTSPYAYLRYGANMYMGRRIASELKTAEEQGRLDDVTT